jgi:hypothetical protein
MAKLSLIDMVQNILSAMESDVVNGIDDTVESVQVADLVREAYYELMSQREWPFLRQLSTLDGLGDTQRPTHMAIPDLANKIYWVKYNKKEITWMEPADFDAMINQRVEQVGVINANGFVINADPAYWTSYDDSTIVFDGYDSAVDSTLQSSKSSVYMLGSAAWTHTDNFVPNLPEKFFPTLLAEAKSSAFVNLKQQQNPREERRAQRGRVTLLNGVWKNENGEAVYNGKVNYGRR